MIYQCCYYSNAGFCRADAEINTAANEAGSLGIPLRVPLCDRHLEVVIQRSDDLLMLREYRAESSARDARRYDDAGQVRVSRPGRQRAQQAERWAEQERIDALRLPESDRWVYYVQRVDGAIKIGTTWDIDKRLASFRHVVPVELLAKHRGGRPVEQRLHIKFARHRIDGEWFLPHTTLLKHVGAVRQTGECPVKFPKVA